MTSSTRCAGCGVGRFSASRTPDMCAYAPFNSPTSWLYRIGSRFYVVAISKATSSFG
jgi:hypothetical protein